MFLVVQEYFMLGAKISLVTHPNQKHVRKGTLGNVLQPSQVDTL